MLRGPNPSTPAFSFARWHYSDLALMGRLRPLSLGQTATPCAFYLFIYQEHLRLQRTINAKSTAEAL